jgi:septum formation protein
MTSAAEIVLASTSDVRRRLLESAGISARVVPPTIDETQIKNKWNPAGSGGDLALRLAAAKAEAVSLRHPRAVVIGADQILILRDRIFDKPRNLQQATLQLSQLRGNTHSLMTAVSVARNGTLAWNECVGAELTMRTFSDAFLATYLASIGDDAFTSVGAYKLEGRGVQLFDRIEGDYFSILGLPLIPLLSYLRSEGCLPT